MELGSYLLGCQAFNCHFLLTPHPTFANIQQIIHQGKGPGKESPPGPPGPPGNYICGSIYTRCGETQPVMPQAQSWCTLASQQGHHTVTKGEEQICFACHITLYMSCIVQGHLMLSMQDLVQLKSIHVLLSVALPVAFSGMTILHVPCVGPLTPQQWWYIPTTIYCPSGWTWEYYSYLMTSDKDKTVDLSFAWTSLLKKFQVFTCLKNLFYMLQRTVPVRSRHPNGILY